MLDKFKGLLTREKKDLPMHIAITTNGKSKWGNENSKSLEETYQRCFSIISNTLKTVVRLDIPITTFYLLPYRIKEAEFAVITDALIGFFNELSTKELVHKNKIKISVWGKWYELPDRVIEPIKAALDSTKDYDSFFLNLCINYNGQEEIVDACKLIAMKIKAEKLEPESINKELFKENLYSSSFLPPELIIKNGAKRIPNLLLWVSADSKIFFTGKTFLEFSERELLRAIEFYKSKDHVVS